MTRSALSPALVAWSAGPWCGRLAADPKPLFDSKLVTTQTKGHAVDVDVDITGAKKLYLVVTDGGNGFAATGPTGPSRDSSVRKARRS